MADLTSFDVIVALLVGLAALAGLARGFVGEITSLFAWVAGILAVRFFHDPAKVLAARFTGTESGGAILAFVVLFLGAFLVVRVFGGQLSRGTKASLVGPVDRLLGLGFGAAKGVLAAALLFLLTHLTYETIDPGQPMPVWLATAQTAPTLAMVSKVLVDFVEEQRRVAPESADSGARNHGAHGTNMPGDSTDEGYAPGQRSALDKLLDAQEKRERSTAI
jgi:membrane protein required for colicin V production